VLVPVKSFSRAKLRLAGVLDPDARSRLARELGARVLRAADGLPRYVVCDDEEVADWAVAQGARVLWTPGRGLSGAVGAAVRHLGGRGVDLAVVAHADLPLVASLGGFGTPGMVTLAPDLRLDGTNVAAVPARSGFRFAYGPGSFQRHREEAGRLGLSCRVVHDWRLAADVDHPADLSLLQ